MTTGTVFARELRRIFRRDSKLALILFGIPVLYSILFGFVYSSGVAKYIPTVIYDQDQTAVSRSLAQAFADSERYHVVAQVTEQEAMEQLLQNNEALVAVVIPPDFARNIKLGLASEVLVQVDAVNLLYANTVISASQEIVQTFSAGAAQKLAESLNLPPAQALKTVAPVRLGIRIINNPALSYSSFVLPGLGANGLQLGIMLAVCTVLASVYTNHEAWRGAPAAAIVVGRLLPYWLCGTLAFLAFIIVIAGFFAVPLKGSIGSLLLIGSAFSFAVVGVGGLYSAIASNELYSLQLPMLYIMPAFLFSGYSWPHMAMNEFSRAYSAILPLTYAADTIRDIMLAGYAPFLWRDSAILFGAGAALWLAALAIFAVRMKKLTAAKGKGVAV